MTRPEGHRVVIVGGGFAGLYAARSLKRAPVRVTLIDRRNFHLFQPLLYQVATGGISPADISAPLRAVLKRHRNTRVLLDEVTDIDPSARCVRMSGGELGYDTLIVATGASHHYFGNEEWAERAPGLKTVEDATRIRSRILGSFEAAEHETDPRRRDALLSFVIVGAGPTGVELAGAIAELAKHTLIRDFRTFDPASARVVLVEGAERVLPPYHPALSRKALRSLERVGAEVRTGTLVSDIDEHGVTLQSGERIEARTVLWAAGVRASPLASKLAERCGARRDRAGRVFVEPDCTLAAHPDIFVLGDLAHQVGPDGQPLPGVAPVAMQQGRYAARCIRDRLRGRPVKPFRYRDKGSLAVIGRAAAVAELGRLRISGYFAWLLWLFVHIMYLVEFENRLLVFVQWAYSYFTRNRGARLIANSPDTAP